MPKLHLVENPFADPGDLDGWVPPNLKKKKKKKKSEKDVFRDKLRERFASLDCMAYEGKMMPLLTPDENLKNALKVMGGDIVKSQNVNELLNGLISFIERKGYSVVKNMTTEVCDGYMEYIIARDEAIEYKQFGIAFYKDDLNEYFIQREDSLYSVFRALEHLIANDHTDVRSHTNVRNGFMIAKFKDSREYDKLYEWMNTQKYFGKRALKKASADKALAMWRDAQDKLYRK